MLGYYLILLQLILLHIYIYITYNYKILNIYWLPCLCFFLTRFNLHEVSDDLWIPHFSPFLLTPEPRQASISCCALAHSATKLPSTPKEVLPPILLRPSGRRVDIGQVLEEDPHVASMFRMDRMDRMGPLPSVAFLRGHN